MLLVRHGRTTANTAGILAGRTLGISLDDAGVAQARATAERVGVLPVRTVVSSPLERCRETADQIAEALGGLEVQADERFTECGYGEWTGRALKELAKEPLWKVVQAHPSGVTFPGGESMRAMQARAVDATREWDAKVAAVHGQSAIWVAVSHGDVIKAILADALAIHLDNFQRIVVDPASVSCVSYTPTRPFVVRANEHGDLSGLKPPDRRRRRRPSSDAIVGGGAG